MTMLTFSRFLRSIPSYAFMKWHRSALFVSSCLVVASFFFYGFFGLDFGIDFRGGTLMEVAYKEAPSLAQVREDLQALNLGDVQIQTFGDDRILLLRVQRQQGDEKAQMAAVAKMKQTLGEDLDYRRTEFVGPRVGAELINRGISAVLYALLAMLFYIWLRFDGWYFALAALTALVHDVILTIGLFSLLQLEFNLSTVAALLTIAGYSINDTVVVFDRIRENLRRYRSQTFSAILDLSINGTLARTLMTSVTTALALLALLFFGGDVIHDFVFAMLWGVLIGTWSSIFVAAPFMLFFGFDPQKARVS